MELSPIPHTEQSVNLVRVDLHRVRRDPQRAGYLLVALMRRKEDEHLLLATCQPPVYGNLTANTSAGVRSTIAMRPALDGHELDSGPPASAVLRSQGCCGLPSPHGLPVGVTNQPRARTYTVVQMICALQVAKIGTLSTAPEPARLAQARQIAG
jgi:hypothetical protein